MQDKTIYALSMHLNKESGEEITKEEADKFLDEYIELVEAHGLGSCGSLGPVDTDE